MSRRPPRLLLVASALAAAGAWPLSARADGADDPDDPAVVPYRPSVSTPAALPAPGWLEMEAGGIQYRGPARLRVEAVPLTFKLAFTPDWGVVAGLTPWLRVNDGVGAASRHGFGDTMLMLKHRLAVDDAHAFGLELGTKLPTAASGLGSGHADVDVNGIYSADFAGAWHTDLNVNMTRLGGSSSLPVAWQAGWAAAFSRSFGDQWGAVGELSGTHQPGQEATQQLLLAASFNASHAAVFDAGLAHGLNRDTPHLQLFAGVTLRLGKLF